MSSRGFTLIELMIVVAIISILSAMAIPSYQKYIKHARFTEVITSAEIYKTAVALALQTGVQLDKITTGTSGIPDKPKPTNNLADISVESGVITATGSELTDNSTYILKPNTDGTRWSVSGSCVKSGFCSV